MPHDMRAVLVLVAGGVVAAGVGGCAGNPSPAKTTQADTAATRTSPEPAPGSDVLRIERKDARAQYTAGTAPVPQRPQQFDAITQSALRERSLELLTREALSESAMLRANSIEALHPVPTRAEAAARAGLTDSNIGVRYVATMTVGKLKLSGMTPAVRPLLQDPEPLIRAAAIYALARNGEKVDQTPLGQLLMDSNPRVRSNTAYLLGELGNPSAIPMLKEAARMRAMGDSTQVRLFNLQVAEALIKLGELDSANSLEAALYPKLAEDFEAAVLSAQIIGEVKNRRAIWQLVNLIETQATGASGGELTGKVAYLYPKELRLAAATALAKMGEIDGVFVADELVGHPDPVIRSQVAFLYAATGQRAYLRRLEPMLSDDSPLVRVAAAAGILKLIDGPRTPGR